MSRNVYRCVKEALEQVPRISLTRVPTPLDYLPYVSSRLRTKVFLKRDDLTDLTLGGDKPRKLEYELAAAQSEGATTLVTCGSPQSNHARLTAAAARKIGMRCAVVLSRDERQQVQGNLLVTRLIGAEIRVADTTDHWQLHGTAQTLCDELRARGEKPYFIPVSGSTPLSCLGYVRAGFELAGQLAELDVQPNAIYTPFGTGAIFTAMLFAMRASDVGCPFVGISVNRDRTHCGEQFAQWWKSIAEVLQLPEPKLPSEIELYDEFVGREYGDPTAECLDAIVLMAEREGLLLDPVYSGKVFAALVAHQAAGRWKPDESVVILHSGGTPALFAYHEEIKAYLQRRNQHQPGN